MENFNGRLPATFSLLLENVFGQGIWGWGIMKTNGIWLHFTQNITQFRRHTAGIWSIHQCYPSQSHNKDLIHLWKRIIQDLYRDSGRHIVVGKVDVSLHCGEVLAGRGRLELLRQRGHWPRGDGVGHSNSAWWMDINLQFKLLTFLQLTATCQIMWTICTSIKRLLMVKTVKTSAH